MSDVSKIAKQMKDDWDRRVGHDYRFWMSDGYADDETMWETGQRDFAIVTKDIENPQEKSLLELGCGVGRLLGPAVAQFSEVIGIDVSQAAIDKAREFLGQHQNLSLHAGSGIDLQPVADNSVDVVVSFAALTSVPTEVVAHYFREMHRVLKPGGTARIQMYVGKEQSVRSDDTLHLRCFDQENFKKAVEACCFELEYTEELVLPFQVSFKEVGIMAVVISLRKGEGTPAPAQEVAALLLPGGEVIEQEVLEGNELEYWMTVNYAKELVESGDFEKAKQTIDYALAHCKTTTLDVSDLLQEIISTIEKKEKAAAEPHGSETTQSQQPNSPEYYEKNRRVLQDRFPEVYGQFESWEQATNKKEVGIKSTDEGPILFSGKQCQDHPTRPKAAADKWAGQALSESGNAEANSLVVFGMGAGYHVESLQQKFSGTVSLIEPRPEIFLAALGCRDLSQMLLALDRLVVGIDARSDFFGEGSGLLVRPATQASSPDECSSVRSKFYGARGISTIQPKIAVLGPLQGGTLPIAGYTTSALMSLNQRIQLVDMSVFAKGFTGLDNYVHDDLRKALLRNHYTEMLSNVVIEAVKERPIDILICMAQAPITAQALTELRKQGVVTVLWFVEDYLRFTYWKPMAQFFDFIFTIQKGDCLNQIKAAGAGHVHYLPTACDPGVHRPVELNAEETERWGSPISFVGAGYHNRQQSFASLAETPFKIWGTEWPECRPFDKMVQEKGRRLTPEEYIKIFNSTQVNLNLHSSTERDGVDPYGDFLNPRTFELAAAGAFQLVDHRSLLPEAFEPGKEVITFNSVPEMREQIQHYLAHPEERQQVTQAARARALRDHTYVQRLEEMLSVIYSTKYEHLKRKLDSSPWTKMLRRAEHHPELHERCKIAFQRGEEAGLDGLVADIVNGKGKLTETEQKLLFLFHIRKQMIRMRMEETGAG